MRICERSGSWSQVMLWAALALAPLSILSSGHGPVTRFVTGAAAAMLVVGAVRTGSCLRR